MVSDQTRLGQAERSTRCDSERPKYRCHIQSRAVRRRNCVGGGGPINFGLRRRPKNRRRPNFFQRFPKIFRSISLTFSDDFFSPRNLQQNKYTGTMASAARRQIIGGGRAPKLTGGAGRRRPPP